MKITKRVLSILLAALLILPLGLSAFAADDPNAPVITLQPQDALKYPYSQVGRDIKLQVKAQSPTLTGTLSYAWYDYAWEEGDTEPPIATGASVSIPATKDMLEDPSTGAVSGTAIKEISFWVVVTNTYTDSDGAEQTAWEISEPVTIKTFTDVLSGITNPWISARNYTDNDTTNMMMLVMLIPILPFQSLIFGGIALFASMMLPMIEFVAAQLP